MRLTCVQTCQAVVELVTDYLEDALPPSERAAFEEHLAACDGCAAYVDQMRRTVQTLRSVGPDLPIPSCDHLVELFRLSDGS